MFAAPSRANVSPTAPLVGRADLSRRMQNFYAAFVGDEISGPCMEDIFTPDIKHSSLIRGSCKSFL